MISEHSALRIETLADGRHRIELDAPPNFSGASPRWVTRYPLPLIHAIYAVKGRYACDEIMREEDPAYVERAMRHEVLGYVNTSEFAGKRVLDFGCGAGASTLVLRRLLPPCAIVGIELQERLVTLARLRAAMLRRGDVQFLISPSGTSVPKGLGSFDYVVFSAVYEHLLPGEREALLPQIWRCLRPNGVLFINQTPHRWSPVEMHTTRLPLINYLPDKAAFQVAHAFSRTINDDDDWQALLRAGIRGATIGEILHLLRRYGSARLLDPRQAIGDQIDLWYGKLSRRHAWLKKSAWTLLKILKPVGGIHLIPELTLAIRKLS